MLKLKNVIFLALILLQYSCWESGKTNQANKKDNLQEINFDGLLNCMDYSYDNGYFFTADYGCVYNPDGDNNYGNAIIYLLSKKKQQLHDDQIEDETTRVNKLSIAELKEEFNMVLFLIEPTYLNQNTSADPTYYQKSNYIEKVYVLNDSLKNWTLLDSINVADDNQNQIEQNWSNSIVAKYHVSALTHDAKTLKTWEGIYLNSDNPALSTSEEIIEKIGWYAIKISENEIKYINDGRMESEFPAVAPGGISINYLCDYHLSGDTIKLYEKKEMDYSPPINTDGKGQELVLELLKKDQKYYVISEDITESENLSNAIRLKSKSPYLFYRFDLNTQIDLFL